MSSNMNWEKKKPNNNELPKSQLQNHDKQSSSPKSLLKQIAKVNEMLPPSQPTDSPTVQMVPIQMEGHSRRSSGILATVNTPKTLIQKFLAEAPTETPVLPSNMTGNSISSERSSVPLPAKVMDSSQNYRDLSVTASDLEEEAVLEQSKIFGRESITLEEISSKSKDSHIGFQINYSKGLKRPRKQITAKDIADGVKQSQDAEEDDEISLEKHQKATKIRKKITADDIAVGIKQSQEAAVAAEEKPANITEMSKSYLSLGFLTVNSENAENFLNCTNQSVEDSLDESDLPEDCSNLVISHVRQSESDAVQTEHSNSKHTYIGKIEKNPSNILNPNLCDSEFKKEQTLKIGGVCLEESLKVLRDASRKHVSKENLEDESQKPDNSMISQPRKSVSMTESISSFQLSPDITKDLTHLTSSKNSVYHTSHVHLTNSSCSPSFLKKLTVSLTDISCIENQQFMSASTKSFLNSSKIIKCRDKISENKNFTQVTLAKCAKNQPSPILNKHVDSDWHSIHESQGKEKGMFLMKEKNEISSDSSSSSDSELKISRKISSEKNIESKQSAANISSKKYSDRKNIAEEKPDLKEVTADIASLKLKEKSTNCEVTLTETKTEQSNVETDKDIFIENPVEISMETKDVEYTSEFIQTFSLGSLNEETVSSDVCQNETDENVVEVDDKNEIEDCTSTQEGQNIADQSESKNNYDKMLDEYMELSKEPDKNFVPVDNNIVLEVQHEEMIVLEKDVIEDENEVIEVQDEPIIEIQDEEYINLHNEELIGTHSEAAFVCQVEDKDTKHLQRKDQMTLDEGIGMKNSYSTEEMIVDVRDDSMIGVKHERETRKEKEISSNEAEVVISRTQEEKDFGVVNVINCQGEVGEKSGVGENYKNFLQDKVDVGVTNDEGEVSVIQSKEEVSAAQKDEEEIPLFEIEESMTQEEIIEISDEVDESTKGENMSVTQDKGDPSLAHDETDTGLTLDKSMANAFNKEDDISETQHESEDMAQNEAEIGMPPDESKAGGTYGNKIGAPQNEIESACTQERNEIGVTQAESKADGTQDESEAGVTQEVSEAGVTQDESEAGVTQDESEAGVTQDESEAGVTPDESEAGVTPDESEAGVTPDESEAGVTPDESEAGMTPDESEAGVTPDESEAGVTPDESEAGVTPDESEAGVTSDESEAGVTPDESEAGVTPDESKAGVTQEKSEFDAAWDENEAGATQDESEVGATQGESEAGATQDESEAGATQDESQAGATQDESQAGATQDESEAGATQDESEAGATQDESAAGATQDESEAGATRDESEAGATRDESEAGATRDESEAGATRDESEAGATRDESEAGATRDESEAGATRDESEAGATRDESEAGATRDESEAGATRDESEAGATRDESEAGATRDESEAGVTRDESEAGATRDESEAGATRDESEAGATRDESEAGATQGESEAGATQDESEAGATQDESEAVASQDESEAVASHDESEAVASQDESEAVASQDEIKTGASQDESEVVATQGEREADAIHGKSEAGATHGESETDASQSEREDCVSRVGNENCASSVESENCASSVESENCASSVESEDGVSQDEGEVGVIQYKHKVSVIQEEIETSVMQDDSKVGITQDRSKFRTTQHEVVETQEENEAGVTQEENKACTGQDKTEFSVSQDESKVILTLSESEAGITPDKSKIETAQEKNMTLNRDGMRTRDQYAANVMQDESMTAATNNVLEVKKDGEEEQKYDIKVKSESKSKHISIQRENKIQQVNDEIIFHPNLEHSKEDYFVSKESQIPSGHSLQSSSIAISSVSNVSPKPSTSQNLSLKRKGRKRKSAANCTAEASAHFISEKLRRQNRETNLSKTRSYRIVDSLSGIEESMTISNQTTSQSHLDTVTVPNKSQQHSQKTDQQIPVESSKISESPQPKKKLKKINQAARRGHADYVVPAQVTSSLLSHYSKLLFPSSCANILGLISNDYFDNLFATLSSYARKERRLTICQSDVELYLKNVGFTNEITSLNSLIREHLSLVDQQILIPVARAVTTFSGTGQDSKRKRSGKPSTSK